MLDEVDELRVGPLFIIEAEFFVGRAFFAQDFAHGEAAVFDQLFQRCAGGRSFEVFDDLWFHACLLKHGEGVAGGAAFGVVVDDRVHLFSPMGAVNDKETG